MSENRFKAILGAAKGRTAEQSETAETAEAEHTHQAGTPAPPSPAPAQPSAPRRPGRPPGKRSDPTFEQVTAYIPRDLYRDVRIALLQDDRRPEFSELVADLLSGWLASRRSE